MKEPPLPSPDAGADECGSGVGARRLRPLGGPSPARVHTDGRGHPLAVQDDVSSGRTGRGRLLEVVQIREVWRIDDEWWRDPVSRLYFEVILENGKRTVLYRDLAKGRWYRQRR